VSSDTTARAPEGVAARRPRFVPRSRSLRVVFVLGLVLFVWLATAAVLALTARSHLRAAESLLPLARDAAAEADLDTATDTVRQARQRLRSADQLLQNVTLRPFAGVPAVGQDLAVVRTVAIEGEQVTAAASRLLDELRQLDGGLGEFAPVDGSIPVERVGQLAASLRGAADTTASSLAAIRAAEPSGLLSEVSRGHDRVLDLLEPIGDQLETGAAIGEQLPRFLGADEPRTYLFGAATPAEARGVGGFVGSVALLRVEGGSIDFGTFTKASDLPPLEADALPPPDGDAPARWRRYGGAELFVNLTRTPDFPTAADRMLRHWAITEGQTLDGMVVVDPFALEALLAITGPVDVPGYGIVLDSESVVTFVSNEAYALFDRPDERQQVLGDVAAAAFGRLLGGHAVSGAQDVVATLGDLVAGGHMVLYATDPDTQAAFRRAGLAGQLGARDAHATGDLVNLVVNNGGANKVDFYAQRSIELETELFADGVARSDLRFVLENDAPSEGRTKYVIGPNNPTLEAGDNLANISVYLGPNAEFTTVPTTSDGPSYLETELGHPVHDSWVRIPSRATAERHYQWRTEDAWYVDDGIVTYDLLLQGQTVFQPTQVTLRFVIPEGMELVPRPLEEPVIEDGRYVLTREIRGEDLRLTVRFRPQVVEASDG
jgi:hypothetical protein